MKALVISRNLPPMIGGMERLVWHIVDGLSTQYAVRVIGPKGCAGTLPAGVTATEVPLNPIWLFLLCTKLVAIIQALKWRPDLIVAGSGLTAPFVWLAARLVRARCVVYLHGLDIEASSPIYQRLWKPFFRRFDQVLVNSRFTKRLAEDGGIESERILVLNPGVALPDMAESQKKSKAFRTRYQLDKKPVLLYAGRVTCRKGLLPFIRDILPGLVDVRQGLKLVVVGSEPKFALNREPGQIEQIHTVIREKALTDAVLFLGDVSDDQLDEAYFGADVLIFPVIDRKNDHEGFGMVAAEAAAHGLPTVAFAVGGVVDAVSSGQSGSLVPDGDHQLFASEVIYFLEQSTNEEVSIRARAFAENLSWSLFSSRLLDYLGPSVEGKGSKG